MNDEQQLIVDLACSQIGGIPTKNRYDGTAVDWNKVINYCKKLGIMLLIYTAVKDNNIVLPDEANEQFKTEALKSIAYSKRQEYAYKKLISAFGEENIDFLPIKGIVLRELYPQPEMRTMGDIDILVRKEQYKKISPIMVKLGYAPDFVSDYEFVWGSKSGIKVELHGHLISEAHVELYKIMGDGWQYAEKADREHEFCLSPEDFYLYTFVHFSKHYKKNGIGLRYLIDLRILQKTYPQLNYDYIGKKLDSMYLSRFHDNVNKTIAFLFDGGPSDEITEIITDKLFKGDSSVTVETLDYSNAIRQMQAGENRYTYLLKSAFPGKKTMQKLYPVLYRHGYLLPLFWVVRLVSVLFKSPGKIKHIHTISQKMSDKEKDKYFSELKKVGMDVFYGETIK